MSDKPEVWLRGPVNDVPGLLQPIAHALLQSREEISELMSSFPEVLLWEQPAGLASPGFHLQHLAGVLNRLFTYARGQQLDEQQLQQLNSEGKSTETTCDTVTLLANFSKQVDSCIVQLQNVSETDLKKERGVGRAQLPSTVMGLYVHAAEHTMRHTGQLLVTARVLAARLEDGTDARLIT